MEKTKGPIDFIKDLTEKKVSWEAQTEANQKAFNPFILMLFFSMNPDLLEFVNDLQRYTIGGMTSKQVYKLYLDLLPATRLPYNKFIKAKKSEKYNSELVELIANHFMISKRIANEYIGMYFELDGSGQKLKDIVQLYGKTEKEVNKLMINL